MLSVNASLAHVEVCEMDEAAYIHFLSQIQLSTVENCTKKTNKDIALKNRFWNTTPTTLDIEKEILGHAFTEHAIFIRGYLDNANPTLQQGFSQVFLRSNLALTLEDASNVSVLFASSYDGKDIPSDLNFEVY